VSRPPFILHVHKPNFHITYIDDICIKFYVQNFYFLFKFVVSVFSETLLFFFILYLELNILDAYSCLYIHKWFMYRSVCLVF
jgi:hypothetical protein